MCLAGANLDFVVGYIARGALIQAVAKKCGINTSSISTLECSRLRGGHWELKTEAGWQRSTDLLNTAASS